MVELAVVCSRLVDNPPYRDDPLINFWYGLNLHHMWFGKVSEDVKKYGTVAAVAEPVSRRASSVLEGTGETSGIHPDQRLMEDALLSTVQVEGNSVFATAGDTVVEDVLPDMKPSTYFSSQHCLQERLYSDEDLVGHELKRENLWSSAVVFWSPGKSTPPFQGTRLLMK